MPYALIALIGVLSLIRSQDDGRQMALNRQVIAQFDSSAELYPENQAELRFVEGIAHKLAPMATVRVTKSVDVQAAALPSMRAYVSLGLLRNFRNEAELAGVLAHEIAHSIDFGQPPILMYGADSGLCGRFGSAMPRSAIPKSQERDRAVDEIAVAMLEAAGYDSSAMFEFFQRLPEIRPNLKPFVNARTLLITQIHSVPQANSQVVSSSRFAEFQAAIEQPKRLPTLR